MEEKEKISLKSGSAIVFLILSIFSKELASVTIGGSMIDMFGYTFFCLYFISHNKNLYYSRTIIGALLVLTYFSLFSVFWLDLKIFPFLTQIIPITIIFLSSYDILYRKIDSIRKVFELYVRVAYFAAIFGIIQWTASLFGIFLLIKQPGLLDSITYEPSHYAAIIIPAALYRITLFKENRIEAIILVISLVLTFSLTSYVVLFTALLIPRFKIITLPIIFSLVYGFYLILPLASPRIKDRIESSEEFLIGGDYNTSRNMSVVSLTSNLDVAIGSIKANPLWGSGLGGHESMYYKYFEGKSFEYNDYFGMNDKSAHSMTIRIISETGIIGSILFLLFLYRTYIPRERTKDFSLKPYHVISLACISHFLVKTFKLGGYIDYGTPFFFMLLIVNYMAYKKAVNTNFIEEDSLAIREPHVLKEQIN